MKRRGFTDEPSRKASFDEIGGYSEKVTPVPIPNTVVKLLCAENTWRATSREHKSPPVPSLENREICSLKIFLFNNIFLYSSVGRACGC